MTVKERILALKLLEKQNQNPAYTKQIGIQIYLTGKGPVKSEEKHV